MLEKEKPPDPVQCPRHRSVTAPSVSELHRAAVQRALGYLLGRALFGGAWERLGPLGPVGTVGNPKGWEAKDRENTEPWEGGRLGLSPGEEAPGQCLDRGG